MRSCSYAKKINKTDLRLGMYIHEFGGSWLDHPFLRSRFLLKSIDDLNKIKASKVLELIIDIGKGIDVEIVASSAPTKENTTKQSPTTEKTPVIISASLKPTTSEIEIGRAAQICAQSKKAVLDMFHDARMGKAVKVEQANQLVSEISESVLRNPNALISLARLKNADEYTYMHSVAVCDVYDAVTSNRPYKAGRDPAESLKRMASWEGHFDTKVFQAFVKTLGIYPVGSLVRLQSGRLAVVLDQHKDSLLTPRVKVFFSAKSNTHLPQEIVDISKRADKIVGRESPQNWKFPNFDELWTGLPSTQW